MTNYGTAQSKLDTRTHQTCIHFSNILQKLACCSSASDNTRENMQTNKVTGEVRTHVHSFSHAFLALMSFKPHNVNTNFIKNAHKS